MLINLLPDFFAVLNSTDRTAAYLRYISTHRPLLEAYWRNYVVEPDGPVFLETIAAAAAADRSDLRAMLERVDMVSLARTTEQHCRELLEADVDVDIVLMVGVGAANAGELVVEGRGTAFVCLEHFTGVANPSSQGLGLDPELIPMWLAHEYAHVIRYLSPTARNEFSDAVYADGGNYSYWTSGQLVSLGEHLVNEGLAVQTSRAVSPGHAAWEYFGYGRRQYARVRELEPVLARAAAVDMDRAGLGLRLKYLSGGMSDNARTVDHYVLPERSGYYLGARLTDMAVDAKGLAWAVRAHARDVLALAATSASVSA